MRQCHRCNSDNGFLLLNSEGECYTCLGSGFLSDQHAELFDLGFSEEVNLTGEYSMFLFKELNELEILEAQVKRDEDESFFIAMMDINSPHAHEFRERIQSLDDMMRFLKLLDREN